MDDARRLAEAGATEGTTVVAEAQTGGRGRAGRAWTSPAGGLYLSVVLRPSFPVEKWPLIPIAAGVAVHEALAVYARGLTLKWPNDVLVQGRKIAGVLVETKPPRHAIVGVGANIGPDGVPDEGTSLAALGASVDIERLTAELLACLETRYAQLKRHDDLVRQAWETRAGMLGAHVTAEGVTGTAVRLAANGALVVRTDDGIEVEITAGDVGSA